MRDSSVSQDEPLAAEADLPAATGSQSLYEYRRSKAALIKRKLSGDELKAASADLVCLNVATDSHYYSLPKVIRASHGELTDRRGHKIPGADAYGLPVIDTWGESKQRGVTTLKDGRKSLVARGLATVEERENVDTLEITYDWAAIAALPDIDRTVCAAPGCGRKLPVGSHARKEHCNDACRAKAARARKAAERHGKVAGASRKSDGGRHAKVTLISTSKEVPEKKDRDYVSSSSGPLRGGSDDEAVGFPSRVPSSPLVEAGEESPGSARPATRAGARHSQAPHCSAPRAERDETELVLRQISKELHEWDSRITSWMVMPSLRKLTEDHDLDYIRSMFTWLMSSPLLPQRFQTMGRTGENFGGIFTSNISDLPEAFERSRIEEKVLKLLCKAADLACSDEEAETLFGKAEELIEKYELTEITSSSGARRMRDDAKRDALKAEEEAKRAAERAERERERTEKQAAEERAAAHRKEHPEHHIPCGRCGQCIRRNRPDRCQRPVHLASDDPDCQEFSTADEYWLQEALEFSLIDQKSLDEDAEAMRLYRDVYSKDAELVAMSVELFGPLDEVTESASFLDIRAFCRWQVNDKGQSTETAKDMLRKRLADRAKEAAHA